MGDLDDDTLARLGHLNHLEFSRESIRWSGRHGELVERDGVLLMAGATDFPVAYNAVARLEPDVPAAEVLATANAFFAAKGRGYTVMASAHHDVDEDLAIAAKDAGHLRVTDAPEMVVFDLDPGPGAGMVECAEVGLWIRDVLAGIDLVCVAKTSGSKGLQLYVPLNAGAVHTHEQTSSFAHTVAQVIERAHPKLVVTVQTKALRKDKVLIDWSQNSRHKTTVCVYSLRARPRPTVSTPVDWDEVEAAADGEPLTFETDDVLTRVEERGDLFADAATVEQHLPR